MDFGYKYDFPVNKFPHALTYCSDRNKLKKRQPNARISEPVDLAHRKTPSMFSIAPEVNDTYMKPFGYNEKPYPGPYKVDPPYHLYAANPKLKGTPAKKKPKKKKAEEADVSEAAESQIEEEASINTLRESGAMS